MRRFIAVPVAVALAMTASACSEYGQELAGPEVESASERAAQAAPAPAPGGESIAEIAIGAGFDELVGALVYVDEELDAGLVDLFLNGTDQYTVFAPTNEAFANLYDVLGEDVDGIRDLPAELVLDVLFYHVTEGRRAANSVVPRVGERTIETLLGQTFNVTADGSIEDYMPATDADIIAPNISASNGIIHVVDEVLLPSL
ncbi:MAG: fasciclin domain-containing protein [Longimicrobiales bacterium]|nr:fasciclin domain-containing protein [Longimicrobiales bacterium]